MHVDTVIQSTWLVKHLPMPKAISKYMDQAWAIPVFGRKGAQAFPDRKHCIDVYNAWVDDVKRTVPADQLLLFDLKDGWAPLCKFLGKPLPAGTAASGGATPPFPRVNETATFQRNFSKFH